MAYNLLRWERDQSYLMPPSMRDWLSEGHLAWFIVDAVGQMDLREFYAAYRSDGWGAAVYDPGMMVAILLYAYCLGLRSSRRIAIWTVTHRSSRDAPKTYLVKLEPFSVSVVPRVKSMRAVGETGGGKKVRCALPQQATQHIEDTAQGMGSRSKRSWLYRIEQATFGNAHIDVIVKAVVEKYLGIVNVDHIDADEHLEHFVVQVEVDGTLRLRVGAFEVEDQCVPIPPHRASDLVGPHTNAVVAYEILLRGLRIGCGGANELQHSPPVPFQELIYR